MVREGINDNLAQKIIVESLKFPIRLISFVGKPFFLALLATIYFLYITGYFFRVVSKNFLNYFISIILTISTDLPRQIWRRIVQLITNLIANASIKTNSKLKKSIFKNNSSAAIEIQNLRQKKLSVRPKNKPKNSLDRTIYLSTLKNILLFFLAFIKNPLKKSSSSSSKKYKQIANTLTKIAVNSTLDILLKLVQIIKRLKLQYFSSKAKLNKKIKKIKTSLTYVLSRPLRIPAKLVQILKTVTASFNRLNIIKLFRVFIFPKKYFRKLIRSFTKPKKISVKSIVIRARLPVLIALFIITLSLGSYYIFWKLILNGLPQANELVTRVVPASTKIYDRNHVLLYTIYKDYNRTPILLSDIPAQVKLSTLAIEDAEFYKHSGFSLRGIIRALYKNLKNRQLTGGSTITQQLVKNTLLSPEKTIIRKLKEVVLAIRVEKTFSKDQILEMYLNEVGYGSTAYGVQEGARLYFGKDVKDLTLAEAALLAGIPKSPTKYSPFGSQPENALIRQKEVLNLMEINGYISLQQRQEAESQEIKYTQTKTDIKAPHFVMYVRDILEQKYGAEMLTQGGLTVVTSLDYEIQKLTERMVSEEIEKLAKLNVTNGAVVVLNPQTGEILAMVGSKNYFDTESDGNVNVATSLRQPGSSIKVVNYAFALSHGYTPATIIEDSPVSFVIPNQKPYIPKNYEGGYRGKMSLRSALAESRNIPAVKVLNSYGVKNMIELGQKMGISTWNNPENYGLSLTLGGGDVKLVDLAFVYATLANYGKKPQEVSILSVTTKDGKILEKFECGNMEIPFTNIAHASSSAVASNESGECPQKQVISPQVAFLLTDILKDNNSRAPSFGTNSQLVIPKHPEVAVKTGTSNNLRDNLTIGYNQKYVVAVWVGNNDNTPMSRIASGVTGASPIWNKIMTSLLSAEISTDWNIPTGLVQLPICQYTASLACSGCPSKMEWFLEENKPNYACKPEQIEKMLTENKKPQILDAAWRSDD